MSQQRMPALQLFIDELRAIWALDPDMGSRMEKAKPHLARLVECKELQERSDTFRDLASLERRLVS